MDAGHQNAEESKGGVFFRWLDILVQFVDYVGARAKNFI